MMTMLVAMTTDRPQKGGLDHRLWSFGRHISISLSTTDPGLLLQCIYRYRLDGFACRTQESGILGMFHLVPQSGVSKSGLRA